MFKLTIKQPKGKFEKYYEVKNVKSIQHFLNFYN